MMLSSASLTRNHTLLVAASTSAVLCAVLTCTTILRHPKRKRATQGKDIFVFAHPSERNEKILASATDLLSEPWGFENCHLASALAVIRMSPFWGSWGQLVTRRTEKLSTPEGGDIEVEFIEPLGMQQPPKSNVPMIILLHGIMGHNREPYIEQAALHIAVEKRWRAVILNYGKLRVSESGTSILGGYNFVDGGDLNFLISHIRKYHDGFLGAIGFSMGGAKLVHYLCRTREHCQLDAACTISSPLDFTANNITVHEPDTFVQRMYHFVVTAALKVWVLKNWNEIKKHPNAKKMQPFRRTSSGLLWWIQATKVTDVDNAITIHTRGYDDIHKYYDDATGAHRLREDVKIPFLCVTALNDPFVPKEIIPGEDVALANENIFIVTTPRVGGHIGFWVPGKGCWATKGSLSFFDSVKLHIKKKPRSYFVRRKASFRAAHYLQRTSSTKLTNYFKFIAHDSIQNLLRDGENDDPATVSKSESFDSQCTLKQAGAIQCSPSRNISSSSLTGISRGL